MASVTARYRYADGDEVTIMVDVEDDVVLLLPTGLEQAKDVAVAGVRELTGIGTTEVQVEEP
jgi:hypothetical protein